MKIAILGAGWYGCSMALELSKDFPNFLIDLYDSKNDIFQGAASNNQNRLHHGFHYPRSRETIEEIGISYYTFINKYGHLTKKVKNNYYLIEKNSHTSLDTYINIYKNFGIPFEIIDTKSIKDMVNIDLIEGGIDTKEEVIDEYLAYIYFKDQIKRQKNLSLYLNMPVNEINNSVINNLKYDLIINCTYINPNLGLISKDKKFDIKYELCVMPVIENIFKKDICITVMDGPFISACQNRDGNLSLFGVVESPYVKTLNLDELHMGNNNLIGDSIKSLLDTSRRYFKGIDKEVNIKDIYLSPKVKIKNDVNDIRVSDVTVDNNVISVLCGKISSVVLVYEQIKRLINLRV